MTAKVVTLVFTDLVGSTALKAQLPGQGLAERNRAYVETVLNPHRERVEADLAAYGGRVVKTEGDAWFLAFDTPVGAVQWAAALQTSHAVDAIATPAGPLRVRIGMHTGSPVADGDDFIGQEVDYAARVATLATGGQIVLSEATAALVRSAAIEGLEVHAHGPRDLKGIGRVPIFEVLHGGKAPQPLAAGVASPANLPPAPERFVGREDLVRRLLDRIREGGVTVLKGEGGIGKTSLALVAAHAVHDAGDLPGGAAWINCELKPDLDECLRQTARVFFGDRMEEVPADACRERVMAHLGAQPAAVLLDNFETVAGDAALVRWLSAVRPPAGVLVTTREVPAGLRGRVVDVRELPRCEAVTLFANRLAERGVEGEGQEALLDDLCAAVGDLPLAIELLAARRVPLPRLLQRVRADLAVVDARGDVTRPGRHQSAQASFNISCEHLSADARDLLCRLSVLPGGQGADLIGAVMGTDDWDEAAEELVDASMWRLEGERYTVHPLIRHLARQALGDRRAEVERAVILAVAQRAVEHGAQSEPGAVQPEVLVAALDWFEAEWRNLVACADLAQEAEDWSTVGRIAEAVKSFCLVRGHWQESADLFQRALEAHRRAGNRAGEGVMLNCLGNIAYLQRRLDGAVDALEQSLAVRRELGDRSEEAKTLNNLGIVRMAQEHWEEAEACYRQSLALWRDLGDRFGEGTTLNGLSNVYFHRGDVAQAEETCRRCLTIWREVGDRVGEGKTLSNLATICRAQDRWREAAECCRESLAIRRELGDRVAEGTVLASLADLSQAQGDLAAARDLIRQAIAVLETTEDAAALAEAQALADAWQAQTSSHD